jgi:hypothetical protein
MLRSAQIAAARIVRGSVPSGKTMRALRNFASSVKR